MVDSGELAYSVEQVEKEMGRKGARVYLEQYPKKPEGALPTGMTGLILAPTPALRKRLKEDRAMPALPYNQE